MPFRESQATAQRVSRPPENAIPSLVPGSGKDLKIRLTARRLPPPMALGKEVGYAAKANVVSKLRVATLAVFVAASALGCSRQAVQRERLPNGSFSFKCDEELWVCLSHVKDVCKGGPYEVLSGHDEPKLHGVDESRVESHR